jgi:hypothetical protein
MYIFLYTIGFEFTQIVEVLIVIVTVVVIKRSVQKKAIF